MIFTVTVAGTGDHNKTVALLVFAVHGVGVADGVGGWRTYGVDPSQFPKSLMAACERMVHTGQFTPRRPVDVLSSGYHEIQQDKAPLIGIECRLSLATEIHY